MLRRINRDQLINLKTPYADNIYTNVTIPSDNNLLQTIPQFEMTRERAILNKSSDFYISVDQVQIPATLVPLFYFIATNQLGTASIYTFDIALYVDDALTYIAIQQLKIPQTDVRKNGPYGNPDGTYGFYIYDKQYLADMINTALAAGIQEAIDSVLFPVGDLAGVNWEYHFDYDSETNVFNMLASEETFGFNGAQNMPQHVYRIELFVNGHTKYMLNGFNYQADSASNDPNNLWQLVIPKDKWHLYELFINGGNPEIYYAVNDLGASIPFWSAASDIIITCPDMPSELMIDGNDPIAKQKILLQFPIRQSHDLIQPIIYEPLQLDLLDLNQDQDLLRLNFDFWILDPFGQMQRLLIPTCSKIQLRLRFIKKQLINNFYRSDEPI